MIVKYTGVPLEQPHPAFKNEPTMWLPMLTIRVGTGHDVWTPRFGAVVDSDSPWCIFSTAIADFLGIGVAQGAESMIGGILRGGTELIYFHKVKIQVENNWNITVTAGFTKNLVVTGILGRNGFFDNFQVHFDHSKKPPQLEIEKLQFFQ